MLVTLLADGGGAIADALPKLMAIAIGAVLLAVFVAEGMRQKNIDRDVSEVVRSLPAEHRDRARRDAPSQSRKWMWCMLALTLYLIGRQVYQAYRIPEVWPDRVANILMYVVFMLLPAAVVLVALLRPAEASDRRLQLGIKLMQASAILLVVWAVVNFIVGAGHWLGGVWFLVIAFTPFLTSGVLSQIKAIRHYDRSDQRTPAPADQPSGPA